MKNVIQNKNKKKASNISNKMIFFKYMQNEKKTKTKKKNEYKINTSY